MTQKGIDRYRMQQVMGASPVHLVAMVYDQIFRSLNRVVQAVEAGEIEARWKANGNALDCLRELLGSLDMERGGEIANYLDQLYRFSMDRLYEVDLRNDAAPAREIMRLLEPVRDSWRELARRDSEEATQASPVPRARLAVSA